MRESEIHSLEFVMIDDPDAQKFQKSLLDEDELGAVIRSHIYVESVLNDLLEKLIPYPEDLAPMHLSYFQKVDLAIALGLEKDMRSPLKALGKIRNEFAHKLEIKLDANRVNAFYKTFSGQDKQIINNVNDSTRKKFGSGAKAKMKHLDQKSKFALYVISLRAALLVVINKIDSASEKKATTTQ